MACYKFKGGGKLGRILLCVCAFHDLSLLSHMFKTPIKKVDVNP